VAKDLGMPSALTMDFSGSASAFRSALSNELVLVLAAIITVYIVLGVLYESFIHPVTILSTLPSAGVGALIALALEYKFSKDEILELYLNKVYFGGGAYGVDAAARKFFGHEGRQLSLGEAAIIAGLVKAPSHYSPTADQQAAIDRAKVVLEVMVDAGAITPSQADNVDLKS
ncbi:hypothetical protein KXW36_001108, partial [Aspergillus fumigatus]